MDFKIRYPAKFGDLVLWRQSIEHIKKNNIKKVIFVTGDRKNDWWASDDGEILGPLPELIHEFLRESESEKFWMYSADQFLKYADEYLQSNEVTEELIAQVKETAELQSNSDDRSPFGDWKVGEMSDVQAELFYGNLTKTSLERTAIPEWAKRKWVGDAGGDLPVEIPAHAEHEIRGGRVSYRLPYPYRGPAFKNWISNLHRGERIIVASSPEYSVWTTKGMFSYSALVNPGPIERILNAARRSVKHVKTGGYASFTLLVAFTPRFDGNSDNFYKFLDAELSQNRDQFKEIDVIVGQLLDDSFVPMVWIISEGG